MISTKQKLNFDNEILINNEKVSTIKKTKYSLVNLLSPINSNLRPKILTISNQTNNIPNASVVSNGTDKIFGITEQRIYSIGQNTIIQKGVILDVGLVGSIGDSVYCNLSGELTITNNVNFPPGVVGKIVGLNPTKVFFIAPEEKSNNSFDEVNQNIIAGVDNPNESLAVALRNIQISSPAIWYDFISSVSINSPRGIFYLGSNQFAIIRAQTGIDIYDTTTNSFSSGGSLPSLPFFCREGIAGGTNYLRRVSDLSTIAAANMNYQDIHDGFVAVGSNNPYVTRWNGASYVAGSFPGGYALYGVRLVPGSITTAIAISNTHLIAKTTDSGANWVSIDTNPIFGESRSWVGIAKNEKYLVMVAISGTHRLAYTEDGTNWTQVEIPLKQWNTITYLAELKVFIGTAIGCIFTTKDLINFQYYYDDRITSNINHSNIACDEEGYIIGFNDANTYIKIGAP